MKYFANAKYEIILFENCEIFGIYFVGVMSIKGHHATASALFVYFSAKDCRASPLRR